MTGNYGDTCPHLGGYCKTRAGTSVLLKQADKARGHETTGGSERRVGSTTQACGRGRRSQLPGLRVGGGQGWRHMRGHGVGGVFCNRMGSGQGPQLSLWPCSLPTPLRVGPDSAEGTAEGQPRTNSCSQAGRQAGTPPCIRGQHPDLTCRAPHGSC